MKVEKKKRNKYIAIVILSLIIIIGLSYVAIQIFDMKKEENEYEDLAKYITETEPDENKEEIVEEKNPRIARLEELHSQNEDIIGWIEINGTNISYPVLQTDNNSYYLDHDYKKNSSARGSIFLDKDVDLDKPSSNFLIYGHRNVNKVMFENLYKYKDEKFYQEHKTIRFTTLKEDAEYEILSAFYGKVYDKDVKNVFKYYQFIDAETEEEYNQYVTNVKQMSIYDTNVEAKFGEQLMTLSTCEYSQKNGRFAVVAKKIENK